MIIFLYYFIILFLSYTAYSYYSSGNSGIDKIELFVHSLKGILVTSAMLYLINTTTMLMRYIGMKDGFWIMMSLVSGSVLLVNLHEEKL